MAYIKNFTSSGMGMRKPVLLVDDSKLHDAKYDLELTFQLFKKLCVL